MDFFFQNSSVENSLICPRTKSASHCLTELFPIYQNKHWTIRRRDDHIIVQSSHCNISKIDGFQVLIVHTMAQSHCKSVTIFYRLFFSRLIAQFFYTNLHAWFCQFINWTYWVNSGKFMYNCWISCQVIADIEKIYNDLIIINLYISKYLICPSTG